MNSIKKPRGTQDIYFSKSKMYEKIRTVAEKILNKNNCSLIMFPTFEKRELFERSLGYSSDVVQKEMFAFEDKKGRKMVLRPEGTATVARLVVENNLLSKKEEIRFYYWANMFRYERPQRGRYREFWQLGVELINSGSYLADLQVIKILSDILRELGIDNFKIKINFLGDEKIKNKYKEKLKLEIGKILDKFCQDCQKRYNLNPLRILDCKKCHNDDYFPCYKDFWDEKSLEMVKKLDGMMTSFSIPYEYDYKLVRGLDYYTGIVFEVVIENDKAIGGGGRYDNLYEKFTKEKKLIPATGFAIGIDRLAEHIFSKNQGDVTDEDFIDIFFHFKNEKDCEENLKIVESLRDSGLKIDFNLNFPSNYEISNLKKFKLKIILDSGPSVKIIEEKNIFGIKKCLLIEWINEYFSSRPIKNVS